MTNITMVVEPMVIVKTENDFNLTVEDVFYNPETLQKLHEENWSVEIFWFPFNSLDWCSLMCIGLAEAIKGGPTYGIITEVYSSRRRLGWFPCDRCDRHRNGSATKEKGFLGYVRRYCNALWDTFDGYHCHA